MASARTASAMPRSASTGGCIPRTRSRSSVRALADASRASSSSARAASGLSSITCSAALSVMPIATSRACAPSCRSRSIRRISAAPVSTTSARLSARCATCRSSAACLVGASIECAAWPYQRRNSGASHRPSAMNASPSGTLSQRGVPVVTWMNAYQLLPPAWHDRAPVGRHQHAEQAPDDERGRDERQHAATPQRVHGHPEQVPPGRRLGYQLPAGPAERAARYRPGWARRRPGTARGWVPRTTRRTAA